MLELMSPEIKDVLYTLFSLLMAYCCLLPTVQISYYFTPSSGAKYCNERVYVFVSVCLSVCLSVSLSV